MVPSFRCSTRTSVSRPARVGVGGSLERCRLCARGGGCSVPEQGVLGRARQPAQPPRPWARAGEAVVMGTSGQATWGGKTRCQTAVQVWGRHSCLHAAGRLATSRHPGWTEPAGLPDGLPDRPSFAATRVKRTGQDRTLGPGGGRSRAQTHARGSAVTVSCRGGAGAARGRVRVLLRSVTVCDACPACLLLACTRPAPPALPPRRLLCPVAPSPLPPCHLLRIPSPQCSAVRLLRAVRDRP